MASTIDEYIALQSAAARERLIGLRKAIQKAAPQADEVISYKIPAFTFHGMLVYYAAFKNHIGFYPTSSGIKAFEKDLAAYKGGKGSVQFPFDRPLPLDLISRIVKYRVKENLERARAKVEA